MHTVLTMLATFVVHCLVNMKPLNRTQLTYNYVPINQPTNYNSWFQMRGLPKIPLPRVPIFVDRSLLASLTTMSIDSVNSLNHVHKYC